MTFQAANTSLPGVLFTVTRGISDAFATKTPPLCHSRHVLARSSMTFDLYRDVVLGFPAFARACARYDARM